MPQVRWIVAATAAAVLVVACAPAGVRTAPGGGVTSPVPEGSTVRSVGPTTDLGNLQFATRGWTTDFSVTSVDFGEIQSGGPGKDGIPAIDTPKFESLAAAAGWLDPESPVISLEIDGQARAYPLAILIWHEIVNDTLGGTPVVVTFCPLCHTALAFARELDGTVYDFGTTGNLRYSDLVMYDRQTESWWQQATGQAIVGRLTSKQLTFLPAQIVSLAEFAAAHPEADSLSRDTGASRDYGQNPYVGYDQADQKPFLFDGVVDGRLSPKERVVTLEVAGKPIAVPYAVLMTTGVVELGSGKDRVVVFWAPGTRSALDSADIDGGRDVGSSGVFMPTAGGHALTFSRSQGAAGPIVDNETGSTWSVTGRATSGPLAGETLQPVIHGDHFWFAWAAFQPETTIWTGS